MRDVGLLNQLEFTEEESRQVSKSIQSCEGYSLILDSIANVVEEVADGTLCLPEAADRSSQVGGPNYKEDDQSHRDSKSDPKVELLTALLVYPRL